MDKAKLIGFIGSTYMKLVNTLALNIKKVDYEPVKELIDKEIPFILSMWHSRFFMAPFALNIPCSKLSPMISKSNDGKYLTSLVKNLGIDKCVRGSSSRGGAEALKNSIKMLKKGQIIPITPDGPRGPDRKVQKGAILISSLSGYPIVPFTFNASKKWRVRSWDRTIVPKPCSEFVFVYGNPIMIEKKPNVDKEMIKLEREMERIRELADNWEF